MKTKTKKATTKKVAASNVIDFSPLIPALDAHGKAYAKADASLASKLKAFRAKLTVKVTNAEFRDQFTKFAVDGGYSTSPRHCAAVCTEAGIRLRSTRSDAGKSNAKRSKTGAATKKDAAAKRTPKQFVWEIKRELTAKQMKELVALLLAAV